MRAKWIVATAMGLALLPTLGAAQAGDFPTLQGSSGRVGHNLNPNATGPGRAFINWFQPRGSERPATFIADNTDTLDPAYTSGFVGAPYDPNPNATVNLTAGWNWVSIDNEADFAYVPARRVTLAPPDPERRFPSYYFTRTTSSALGTDPTVAANPAERRFVEWRFQPADTTPRLVAVNVWLPFGPTLLPPSGNPIFTQRYWVYEVLYGAGQRYVEVVDTTLTGPGFFRLGGGGRANRVVFPWDGVNPVRVRLYNTIPRDANGNLRELVGPGNPDNRFVVYADAVQLQQDLGNYVATATSANYGNPTGSVTAVLNEVSVGERDGQRATILQGVVTSYQNNTGDPQWTYTPRTTGAGSVTLDNVRATFSGPWVPSTATGVYQGTNYFESTIAGPSASGIVSYSPVLGNGQFDLYAFVSGNRAGQTFGTRVRYTIFEGSARTDVTINQSAGPGWVRIGSRKFTNTTAARLRVVVTNASPLAADIGRKAYADAIRFVGAADLQITSTPVHARALVRLAPGADPVEREVVVVADESGRIHCLDRVGNGNGTTTVYWTYPSTPDGSLTWTDPNQVAGEDGPNGLAEMPNGFDLSTALIERIGGQDYLYIAARNGRVYSIEMAGRGDFLAEIGQPGTTRRRWSFPSDYPSSIVPSALGPFRGSVAFANTPSGPTIYAAASQGRVYALDALGNDTTKTTTVRWRFPELTQPTLGPISMTPTVAFGNLYFGTERQSDLPGQFWALNANTGAPVWALPFTGNIPPGGSDFVAAGSWLASPAAVSGDTLDTAPGGVLGTNVDTVYALNANRYVYAFNAATGEVQWQTDELTTGSRAGLAYTVMTVYNNAGGLQAFPVLTVPTSDGRFSALFARRPELNRFGTRRAWQYSAEGRSMEASVSVANGWMFGADSLGYLYAFNNTPYGGGEDPPGDDDIVENDTRGDIFRTSRVKFITREAFNALRRPTGLNLTYSEIISPTIDFVRSPMAFEWGETAYILVYDLPYAVTDTNGDPVSPPVVNFTFSAEGRTIRTINAEVRQVNEPPNAPPNPVDGTFRQNGYAVIQFPFQGGGANYIPPGRADLTFTITSGALNAAGTPQTVVLDPALARRSFGVANPIAVQMLFDKTSLQANAAMGFNLLPGAPENLVNGSPDVLPLTSTAYSLMGSSAGLASHGQARAAYVQVVDRSLMTLKLGPGRGLSNVRIDRNDLGWQGGPAAAVKRLDNSLFPGFEDLPDSYPNVSLDYPDIRREQVRVTKDPDGDSQDPVFLGVDLTPPVGPGGVPVEESTANLRVLVPTLFQFSIEVPRFQPANDMSLVPLARVRNSNLLSEVYLPQGYRGRYNVFVDNGGGGRADFSANSVAYRGFWLSTAVGVDEKFSIGTPTLDLGSLAGGTGYSPASPGTGSSTFSPWTGPYQDLFKPFTVRNEGNVNLLNLRVAKSSNVGSSYFPWQFPSLGNDSLAWLNGRLDLWSDIDANFALSNPNSPAQNPVILQKARVGDSAPTELTTNPVRRANPNLNVSQSPLIPSGPAPAPPRLAVTVPVGFPAGRYTALVRVVEELGASDESLALDAGGLGLEAFSDPGVELTFTARETRLTNSYTRFTAPMIDDLVPVGTPPVSNLNASPAGMRDGFGNLTVAFASNRPAWTGTAPLGTDQYRIYIGTLRGSTPTSSPYRLNDLNAFQADASNRWFRQAIENYPTTDPAILFAATGGDTIVANSVRFGSPSLPNAGIVSPFDPTATFSGAFMAFVGEANKQTAAGLVKESRVFITRVDPQSDGSLNVTPNPVGLAHDPSLAKSRPSVLQTPTGAAVYYGASGGGASSIFYSFFDGTNFAPAGALPFGTGFEAVTTPSATGRLYNGADPSQAGPIVELAFSGKLRGRPVAEIYMGRIRANVNGVPVDPGNPWMLLPVQVNERVAATGESGVFRARGVSLQRSYPFQLWQNLGGVVTNLLRDGRDAAGTPDGSASTRLLNEETGIVSYDTRLGGKVFIDTATGTVRFATALPSRSAAILFTYQPRFLRMSQATVAAYTMPTVLIDRRLVSNADYWARPDGSPAQPSDAIRPDRYVTVYNRAAAGAGQAARPFMSTWRLGVTTGNPIRTLPNGAIAALTVSGNVGPYQVDPANGAIYFTSVDEDRVVTISVQLVDGNGVPYAATFNTSVALIRERAEQPVLMDQPVNESAMAAFLDPFDSADRRPGMVWMLWSSNRAGGPDIYLQSIAPRFTPLAVNP